jgi:hypothetical protein
VYHIDPDHKIQSKRLSFLSDFVMTLRFAHRV